MFMFETVQVVQEVEVVHYHQFNHWLIHPMVHTISMFHENVVMPVHANSAERAILDYWPFNASVLFLYFYFFSLPIVFLIIVSVIGSKFS